MKMFMKKAGAGVPSANRITLLRDATGDGMAEVKTPFITDLYSPFGMALVGRTLYVANAHAVVAFPQTPSTPRSDTAQHKTDAPPAGRHTHRTHTPITQSAAPPTH